MDKSKVISAYRRGFISLQECKQILGISTMQLLGMLDAEVDDSFSKQHPTMGVGLKENVQ